MHVKVVETDEELMDAFSVRKKVFIDEQNVSEEEEIDQFESSSTHFVAYENGQPIGAGRFRELDGYGKVERICVLKEYRKSGAGKAIMEKIESFAKEKGFTTLKLNAQTHAIPFYTRLNYEVISDEFLDAGIPHRTMKKSL
ncbi:GNAT family N-acetyltransferase [Bacillus methanolicus]|uniref:GCN5-related N-acetyltransferase n=1 Tax=Bacillus methanolicus (strain MGA3 / ATCC 53907) TaxID=796606 RepID=I3E7T3_BACMM|nr:GNAT family N-acetyltransferase [Bacillus methanolicus]AIE59372.1 GCN5-related N-acetyltransferase [Bacillus methanolicus MGA3]EIJ82554.1 acetyltransferase [Bacillus methanolicus MGA3]UQD51444.1 GNAT family N-acetyltransferase [Bacillus methanolicus]